MPRSRRAGALEQIVRAHDATLRSILGVADPVAWTHKTVTRKALIRSMRDAAQAWVEPLVSRRGTSGKAEIVWQESQWGRSYYEDGSHRISLVELTGTRSAVHEWGHALEEQLPGVRRDRRGLPALPHQGREARAHEQLMPGDVRGSRKGREG